jgi:hypothetical protein
MLRHRCCSFRGSFAKIELATGKLVWQFYTVPTRPKGYAAVNWWAGNAIWGSSPSVDLARKTVRQA